MLHFLDALIGFIFVMLVLSLAITAIVQGIAGGLRNLKGVVLGDNLADLLGRMLPDLGTDKAEAIVGAILRDPLVSDGSKRQTSVLLREEFFRLLLDYASTPTTAAPGDKPHAKELADALAKDGIGDPAALLADLRLRVLDYERSYPELSSSARASLASLDVAAGKFLAKLNGWYDQTIDRVDAMFTARIRVWTLGVTIVLVVLLHLDSLALFNRLSADPAVTSRLVARAEASLPAFEAEVRRVAASGVAVPAPADDPKAVCLRALASRVAAAAPSGTGLVTVQDYGRCLGIAALADDDLIAIPDSLGQWAAAWTVDPDTNRRRPWAMHLIGLALSVSLLSLGAPFWYEALSGFLKLRSVLSSKDDAARAERQMNGPSAGPIAPPPRLPPPAHAVASPATPAPPAPVTAAGP